MDALIQDRWQSRLQIHRYAALIVSIVSTTVSNILQPLFLKQAYHTSALTGEAWVLELLSGHPDRI
jgi:hypothetical protein